MNNHIRTELCGKDHTHEPHWIPGSAMYRRRWCSGESSVASYYRKIPRSDIMAQQPGVKLNHG